MKAFTDRKTEHLSYMVFLSAMGPTLFSAVLVGLKVEYAGLYVLGLSVYMESFVLTTVYLHFRNRHRIMERAITQIREYIGGDEDARIHCDDENELYRLFHEANSPVSILSAHAESEERGKRSMKDTMPDISHQFKTPLTALNIYNGVMREDAEDAPAVRKLAALSEQEFDRTEIFVQNLLETTKLDAGAITLEETAESVSDMMASIEQYPALQAEQGGRTPSFFGDDMVILLRDRNWLIGVVGNTVRGALDHTKAGNPVSVEWGGFTSMVQIVMKDNDSGICPEGIHYILKWFYHSRFPKDTQEAGFGLPFVKATVETHRGTIEMDSVLGAGMASTTNFSIPAKL